MGKTANEIEIERQKSVMLNQGASHNDINNPNTRSSFSNTGKLPNQNSRGSGK